MKIKGWDLSFFDSGEWQVCDERLKDLEKINRPIGVPGYNPTRSNLFKALRIIPAGAVRVAIIAQDPYPDSKLATGVAFSIPRGIGPDAFPATLASLFKEYSSDLHLPIPSSGNLEHWSTSPTGGVLLWNAIPSCRSGHSLSHDWPEWACLTREIIHILSRRGIIFAFLGQVARRYVNEVSSGNNHVLSFSHPSPRGSINSRSPFLGSRLFSTINDRLNDNGLQPVDWKL